MQLLKFHSCNPHFFENLKHNRLFFNNFTDFNDPFEGIFRYELPKDYVTFKDWYLSIYRYEPHLLDYYYNNPQELEEKINRSIVYQQEENVATCFSYEDNLKDILMWSHYADKHTGVCLVFDKNLLKFEPIECTPRVVSTVVYDRQVNYVSDYVYLDLFKSRAENTKIVITTKYSIWSYEKEHRYIATGKGAYPYNRDSLIKIVFGLKTKQEDKDEIKSIVALNFGRVLFYKTIFKVGKFELEIEEDI